MRKFTLVFIFLLSLCVGHVWAIDWVGETITGSAYLYNPETKKFAKVHSDMVDNAANATLWTFKTPSGSTTRIYQNGGSESKDTDCIHKEKNKDWNIVSTTYSGTQAYQFWVNSNGNWYIIVNGGIDTEKNNSNPSSFWYIISQTQRNNRVALDEYFALNKALLNTPPYLKDATYNALPLNKHLNYSSWLLSIDSSSYINAEIATLSSWYASAEADIIAYSYAMQQLEVAKRSGYPATTEETSITNAVDAATLYNIIDNSSTGLRKNAKDFIVSHASSGIDATIFIENNSFEKAMTTGWSTLTEASESKYQPNGDERGAKKINWDGINYFVKNGDGLYVFNTWGTDGYGGDGLYQDISGLPNGYYRVSVLLTADAGSAPCLRVNSTYVTASGYTDKTDMVCVTYDVQVNEGNLTIGARGKEESYWSWSDKYRYYWFKADDFRLIYLGTHPYQSYAYNIVNNASISDFNKSSYTTTINDNPTDDAIISGALNGFRSDAKNYIHDNSIVGQDMTFMLENPDFQYFLDWDYGWEGTEAQEVDGDGTTMSKFERKQNGANIFAWMHRQNYWSGTSRTLAAGDINQTISLPSGVYKLSADVKGSSNDNYDGSHGAPTSTLYAKNTSTSSILSSIDVVSVKSDQYDPTGNTQSITFALTGTTSLMVGAKHDSRANGSRKTISVDNFTLERIGDFKSLLAGESSNYYGMFYNATKTVLLDEGAEAYTASWSESEDVWSLTLTPLSNRIVPAGTPVLVQYNAASVAYTVTDDAVFSGTNAFEIHDYADASDGHKDYVLAEKSGVVAFHRYETDDERGAIDGKIVLVWHNPDGNASAPAMFRIITNNNTATALVPVFADENNLVRPVNMQIYTILGVPVRDMSHPGIYIQNGKKYIVH